MWPTNVFSGASVYGLQQHLLNVLQTRQNATFSSLHLSEEARSCSPATSEQPRGCGAGASDTLELFLLLPVTHQTYSTVHSPGLAGPEDLLTYHQYQREPPDHLDSAVALFGLADVVMEPYKSAAFPTKPGSYERIESLLWGSDSAETVVHVCTSAPMKLNSEKQTKVFREFQSPTLAN